MDRLPSPPRRAASHYCPSAASTPAWIPALGLAAALLLLPSAIPAASAQVPAVSIDQAPAQADPTSASPILFRVVFSEPVTGFATGDVAISGTAGATTATVSGTGPTYTVSVSGMTQSGVVVVSIPAGVAIDLTNNPNTPSTSVDNTVSYVDAAPTVSINQAASQVDPTTASPILFTVQFSEPVTGFTTGDVTLAGSAGATTATVSGSGAAYTVSVSGMTTSGSVIALISSGRAIDSAGQGNGASTSVDNTVSYVRDTTRPTVAINQAVAQVDPTGASPVLFTVVFGEAVTGFATGDVVLAGTAGATTAVVTGSGPTYTVTVSGMTANGSIVATIPAGRATDLAGNPNDPSTSLDNTITFTGIPTTVQAPANLRVWSVVDHDVILRWDAPTPGPPATGYVLEAGLTPGTTIATLPLGPAPFFAITAPAGLFHVRLRALGTGGPSAPSNEVALHVAVPTAPSPPAALRGVANGGLVELSWAPTFSGGAPTAYALDVAGPVSGTVPLGATPVFAFPTVPDGAYTFSVRALNATGGSGASAPVALSFPGACALPDAPASVVAAAQGGVVTLLWDPPSTGGAATSYTLTVSGSVSGAVALGATRLFSSPAPPGSYTLRVTPANSCGAGPASAPITVVVP